MASKWESLVNEGISLYLITAYVGFSTQMRLVSKTIKEAHDLIWPDMPASAVLKLVERIRVAMRNRGFYNRRYDVNIPDLKVVIPNTSVAMCNAVRKGNGKRTVQDRIPGLCHIWRSIRSDEVRMRLMALVGMGSTQTGGLNSGDMAYLLTHPFVTSSDLYLHCNAHEYVECRLETNNRVDYADFKDTRQFCEIVFTRVTCSRRATVLPIGWIVQVVRDLVLTCCDTEICGHCLSSPKVGEGFVQPLSTYRSVRASDSALFDGNETLSFPLYFCEKCTKAANDIRDEIDQREAKNKRRKITIK